MFWSLGSADRPLGLKSGGEKSGVNPLRKMKRKGAQCEEVDHDRDKSERKKRIHERIMSGDGKRKRPNGKRPVQRRKQLTRER